MSDNPAPPLQIRLLGLPEVTMNGQPVSILRRQVRLLLYFLACQREPVRRAWLSDLFWPEKTDQAGREALRDALRRLRQALPLPGLLNGAADLVMLDHPDLYNDVRVFEDAYQSLSRRVGYLPLTEPLPAAIHQEILSAVTLWRSNELMLGVEVENSELILWLSGERHRLAEQRALLLSRLADHEMACGDLPAALVWLGIVAQIHEDDPEVNLRRMRCLEGLGRWGELMFLLDKVEAHYSGEMKGRMPPMLAEYCQGVRQRATPRSVERVVPRLERMINAPDMRFVGRQDILSELRRAYTRGGVLVLWGEAGSGKTRLVYQLYQQLEHPARLLLAPCKSATRSLPFEPLIDLLRHSITPEDWQTLKPVWLTQLSRLVPEAAAVRADIGNTINLSLAEARPLLFQAFYELLLQISRHQRLLFFLDDAQWADEATLALLAFLINQGLFKNHGLLLLAAQVEERSQALEELLSRTPRRQRIQELPLPPLDEAEVAELVRAVLGVASPEQVTRRLVEITGGNPVLLLESFRSMMLAGGDPYRDILAALPITRGGYALIRERLNSLPPEALQTLDAAAVIGPQFTHNMLETVCGLSSEVVAGSLELLLARHLIQPAGEESEGAYRFVHEIFRGTILSGLSLPRRHLLHGRAAAALQPLIARDPAQAALAAQHYEAAGKPQEAFECWLRAGTHALRMMAPALMHQDFHHAEALLTRNDHLFTDGAIHDLYSVWMRVSAEQGNLDEAERLAGMLHRFGLQRASPLLVGAALKGRSFQHLLRSDYPKALETIQAAIGYLERARDPRELVDAYSRLATIYEMDCRFMEGKRALEQALALAGSHDTADMHPAAIESMVRLAYVENSLGFPLKAFALAEQALTFSRQHFYPVGEMRGLAQMAYASYFLMQLDRSLDYCRQGLEIAEKHQYMRRKGYMHIITARVEILKGRLDSSWRNAQTARQIGEEFGYPEMVMEALMIQGEHYRLLRDYPRAIDILKQGLDPSCDSLNAIHMRYRLGFAMVQSGDPAGQTLVDEALANSIANGLASIYLPILTAKAFIAAASNDLDLARQLHAQLHQVYQERNFAGLSVSNPLLLSAIALAENDLPAAENHAREALAVSRSQGALMSDIMALQSVITARRGQNLPLEPYTQALSECLDMLAAQTTLPELRGSLAGFRQAVLASPAA